MEFDRYIGIPWTFGGRAFDGVDCWGLIWLFYRHELQIEIPDYVAAYSVEAGPREIGALIATQLPAWQKTETPAPGDVALIKRAGATCHVGIVAPRRRLLHVESAETASVIEPISGTIKRRMIGAYRPKL